MKKADSLRIRGSEILKWGHAPGAPLSVVAKWIKCELTSVVATVVNKLIYWKKR